MSRPAHKAAIRPESAVPRDGWLRERFKRRRFQQNAMMFVLMLLFGIIIMNHITNVRAANQGNSLAEIYRSRQKDLEEYEKHYEELLAENSALIQQKIDLQNAFLESKGLEGLQDELIKYRILAGFTEVSGPGIILTLDDKPDYTLADSDLSIVHDSDIRHAIDLLTNAGAAAFSINGNRYTNASNIKCIGSTIRCNLQRLSPPYVIVALGNPDALLEAVNTDQLLLYRQSSGIDLVVRAEKNDNVIIPAFADSDNVDQFIDRLEVLAQ